MEVEILCEVRLRIMSHILGQTVRWLVESQRNGYLTITDP